MNKGLYGGELDIYGHDEVIDLLLQMSDNLLQKNRATFWESGFTDKGERRRAKEFLGKPTAFFDIKSKRGQQFGFCMEYEEGKKADLLRRRAL